MLLIRKATILDVYQYYCLFSDSLVRRNSLKTEKATIEEHNNWFTEKINNPDSFLYVLEKDLMFIGQIRYDICNCVAEVDYSIVKDYRKKGYGEYIVLESLRVFCNEVKPPIEVKATVKAKNVASQKIFEKLNFIRASHSENRELLTYALRVDCR